MNHPVQKKDKLNLIPEDWTDDFRKLSHKMVRSIYSSYKILLVSLNIDNITLQSGLSLTTSRSTISIPPSFHYSAIETDILSHVSQPISLLENQPQEKVLRNMLSKGTFYACPVRKAVSINKAVDERILIGRSSDQDIILRDKSVSKCHAWITTDSEGTLLLTDGFSKNGTQINNVPIDPDIPIPLNNGDQLSFGHVKCIITASEPLWLALQRHLH